MSPTVLFLLVVAALLVGLTVAHQTSLGAMWRSQAEWAATILPSDSYDIHENEHGVALVTLTRALVVQGVPCAASRITFDDRGRLTACTLDRDHDHDTLPLRGGTPVRFDPETRKLREGTLREPTVVRGVPCAAGPVTLSYDAILDAELARDVTIRWIPCRRGTRIRARLTPLGPRPLVYTPTITLVRWGMRCAADHEIDELDRRATLADDHHYDGLTLPSGSELGHDVDWDDPWVTLSRPITVAGHRLPEGATLFPAYDVTHPGRKGWWRRWLAVEEHLAGVQSNEPWSVGGVLVGPRAYVRILRSGWAMVPLVDDLFAGGLRYPAGSTITVDAQGQIKRWQAGPNHDGSPIAASPYR